MISIFIAMIEYVVEYVPIPRLPLSGFTSIKSLSGISPYRCYFIEIFNDTARAERVSGIFENRLHDSFSYFFIREGSTLIKNARRVDGSLPKEIASIEAYHTATFCVAGFSPPKMPLEFILWAENMKKIMSLMRLIVPLPDLFS